MTALLGSCSDVYVTQQYETYREDRAPRLCHNNSRGRKRSAVVRKQNMCKYINKTELAARYQISLGTVKNMMRKRVLPYLKIGKVVRFDVERCDKAFGAFECQSNVLLALEGQGNKRAQEDANDQVVRN